MERLTNRSNNPNDRRLSCMNRCYNAGDCINCDSLENAVCRLAAYEDAEEQGRLVMLPVKAGDIVYQLRDKKHAFGVGVHPRYISCVCVYGNDWIAEHQGDTPCWKRDFGKTWFLTREEAEAVLKGDGKDV